MPEETKIPEQSTSLKPDWKKFLTHTWVARNIPFFLFLALLAVIYIYKTTRNPNAPGGAEFVPELVHNRSGVGSAFEVMDLNKDGRPDIAVATAFGTHVFLSKPAPRAAAPAR